jgi:hypothetical protein
MLLRRLGARLLAFDWGPAFVHGITGEDEARLRQLQRLYRSNKGRMLSREEFLNQNTDGAGNPLARVYSRGEALKLFTRYREARTEVHFLNKRWIPLIGRLLPRALEKALARRIGWHLWVMAEK